MYEFYLEKTTRDERKQLLRQEYEIRNEMVKHIAAFIAEKRLNIKTAKDALQDAVRFLDEFITIAPAEVFPGTHSLAQSGCDATVASAIHDAKNPIVPTADPADRLGTVPIP